MSKFDSNTVYLILPLIGFKISPFLAILDQYKWNHNGLKLAHQCLEHIKILPTFTLT